MSRLCRSITMFALLATVAATEATAQDLASDNFRLYIGGQAGAFVYRTPNQTRGGIPMVGGHLLIKARRSGLYVGVEEAFKKNQQSSYMDASGGTQNVTFTDVRRFSFALMAFPVRGAATPYFGLGGGIMNVISPKNGTLDDPIASDLGSTGFGTFMAGLQFRVSGVSAFGQYQIQTIPKFKANEGGAGRLINGTVHSLAGGVRISLGAAREEM
jgi:hypothetical protein